MKKSIILSILFLIGLSAFVCKANVTISNASGRSLTITLCEYQHAPYVNPLKSTPATLASGANYILATQSFTRTVGIWVGINQRFVSNPGTYTITASDLNIDF